MEQIARKIEGMTLYMCNPEINKECDKRFCMYNTNAVDHLCECTSKKGICPNIWRGGGGKIIICTVII